MRIMQLITARQFRGAELFACQLSQELVRQGHELIFVSLYTCENQEFVPEGLRYIDLSGSKSGRFNVGLLWKLYKAIRKFKPQIVQANAGDTLKYGAAVKLFFPRFKLVFRNASTISQYINSSIRKSIQGIIFRGVDLVISVSDLSRRDILSLYPFLENRILVITIGVKTTVNLTDPSFKEEMPFLSHPVFIHIGGLTFEKNHQGLLRIFARYIREEKKGTLLLAGDGPLRKEIETTIRESALGAHVKVLGNRTDVMNLLSGADTLLLPSIIEGLPAVILEAFLCKVPVVAYDVGGIREVVKPNETGWLVEKNDEESFLAAMKEVSLGDNHIEPILTNAFLLVKRDYSNGKIAEQFIRTYKNLVHAKN